MLKHVFSICGWGLDRILRSVGTPNITCRLLPWMGRDCGFGENHMTKFSSAISPNSQSTRLSFVATLCWRAFQRVVDYFGF